jgi:nucleoside-diphosphate kinase
MNGTITLTIIKPRAIREKLAGPILNKIEEAGFTICAMKMFYMSEKTAALFYEVHKERPFYNDLVKFMSSGPVIVAQLSKPNAVEEFRKLIGSTNPEDAADGTIRKLFGKSVQMNAVHGSDSDENAQRECKFFFKPEDICNFPINGC